MGQGIREKEISFKSNAVEVKTAELPAGLYFLKVDAENDKFEIKKRLVIAR
jgi:hypothetical protein